MRGSSCRSSLEQLLPYIDWTFFFAAWELKGSFPAILDHPQYGTAARDLYASALLLLERIVRDRLLTANAVYGFWPAASEHDDIVVYRDLDHTGELTRFNLLRQQEAMASGQPNLSLADFVAPRGARLAGAERFDRRVCGDGRHRRRRTRATVRARARRLQRDPRQSARRSAGRGARGVSARRRAEGMGHRRRVDARSRCSRSSIAASVPAFGYPACPDHSEKFKLFDLLGAREVGIDLTEHAAMTPAASVSGLYFASPHARYFTVGRIDQDQIAAYARRKGQSTEQVERWLTPNLAYEPARC